MRRMFRIGRSLVCGVLRNKIFQPLPFVSTHPVLSLKPLIDGRGKVSLTPEIVHDNAEQNVLFPRGRGKVSLTPEIVQYTLSTKCSSDLIALKFFLWCAEQRDYFHDRQSFIYMADVLSRLTLRYKRVKGVIGELESTGSIIKAKTFLLLLRIYWHGEIHGNVFDTVEEMEKFGFTPNTFTRNVLIDVLFKIGEPNAAIERMRETLNPNFFTFNIALGHFCKLKDLPNVKSITRKLLKDGYYLNPLTYEEILNCFCKTGRAAEAQQVLALLISSGAPVSVNTWSMLIDCFFRACQPSRAADVYRKMLASGFSPQIATYTILIKGFMESQMVDRALSLLSAMKANGHVLDLKLCNVLIDCLSKIGMYNDAQDVLVYLLDNELVPDAYTISSLVSSICLSRRYSILPKILNRFSFEADLVLLNSFLNYFVKAGYPHNAVELYKYMLDGGFLPDSITVAGLLMGLCRAGMINLAVSIYCGLITTYSIMDAHVHTIIIDELFKVGDYDKASWLFKRAIFKKYPLDIVSYTVAICGLLKGGRIGEACIVYWTMKEAGVYPNAQMYDMVISGFCQLRDVKMVKILIQEAKDAGFELKHRTVIRVAKLLMESEPYSSVLQLVGYHGSKLQVHFDENLLYPYCASNNLTTVPVFAV